MYGLDLFSGIGGISIALRDYVRTVAYCEQDRYAQSVLLSRMSEGKLERAPIWDDVKSLRGDMLPAIDIIFGGFPCQDLSVAGRGAGLEGQRSGLFFEIVRLAKETGAPFIFLENVPAIRTRGLSEVVRTLTEAGYDCRWTCLSAASVGAPHKRERWFLLAYSNGVRELQLSGSKQERRDGTSNICPVISDTMLKRLEGQRQVASRITTKDKDASNNSEWTVEPNVGRMANGIPNRSHRIKCLGNAVVPQQAKKAFEILLGLNT